MKARIGGVTMALSCLCFTAACGGGQDKRAEMAPASGWDVDAAANTEEQSTAADATPRTESIELTTVSVQIEQSLAQHCGVPLPNAFFDFDSAEIRPRGSTMLDRLATCLASDAVRDRKVRITVTPIRAAATRTTRSSAAHARSRS